VEETEFWGRLEYRVCEELRGFAGDQLRWLWCDGLIPERYDQHAGQWHISGRAWIGTPGRGSRQEAWTFTLIARHAGDRQAISWDGLLPDGQLTGWLSPDFAGKTLRIDPASGYDDGPEPAERWAASPPAG
jgi:hypothetical protein